MPWGAGVFLATVDASIVNVSLPTLINALHTSFPVVQWVVLAYLLTVTTTMLGFGRLGDIVGKKPIYVLGFVIFTVGSTLCGASESVEWLLGFRVVQAIGAAMIMSIGAAIVTEAFPPAERGKALGVIGAIVSIGIIVGPALGGIIIGTLSWRWIFYVNVPVGLAGTILVQKYVPNTKPKERQSFDYLGALAVVRQSPVAAAGIDLWPAAGIRETDSGVPDRRMDHFACSLHRDRAQSEASNDRPSHFFGICFSAST